MQDTRTTIEIIPTRDSREFAKRVKQAKSLHGKFDPATKTWTIPGEMVKYVGVTCRGVRLATTPERCPHYTADDACPMHGETCR